LKSEIPVDILGTYLCCYIISQGGAPMFSPLIAKAKNIAAESSTSTRVHRGTTIEADQVGHGMLRRALMLQHTIGNQATMRLLREQASVDSDANSALPSYSPARSDAPLMSGDHTAEAEGAALAGDTKTSAPNVQDEKGETLAGDAKSVSTSELAAPEWKDYGGFKWWVKWTTDGTSGWIVQKIENHFSGSRADGSTLTNESAGIEPAYYEAWEVANDGSITGSLGQTGNRDRWDRVPRNGTTGSWSIKGTVYFTSADPQKSGFKSGALPIAGSLLSSKSPPAGLSSALLNRGAYSAWNSTGKIMLPGCFVT
jgi:hypothetical protein